MVGLAACRRRAGPFDYIGNQHLLPRVLWAECRSSSRSADSEARFGRVYSSEAFRLQNVCTGLQSNSPAVGHPPNSSRLDMDRFLLVLLVISTGTSAASAADPSPASFANDIRPLLQKYCHRCHDEKKQEGKVDIAQFGTKASILRERKTWQKILAKLVDEEMPPEEPLPNLHLSLLHGLGIEADRFNTSTGTIADL